MHVPLALILLLAASAARAADPAPGTAAYPNDSGPATIDVSGYPAEMQGAYKLFARRCAACHTLARPINSQFLEIPVLEQGAARTSEPELFVDPRVISVGEDLWKSYVKRMTARKGSPVKWAEGRRIWTFLVYDSSRRKRGAAGAAWRAARLKLVEDFRVAQPERYRALFGAPPPK